MDNQRLAMLLHAIADSFENNPGPPIPQAVADAALALAEYHGKDPDVMLMAILEAAIAA